MEKSNNIKNANKIYIIGIAGISMSALALYLKGEGKEVCGSDLAKNEIHNTLKENNIKVFGTHSADNITSDIDLVIYSLAIKEDNPELIKAKKLNLPCIKRGEALAQIAEDYEHIIAVAGTHGKTTTTAMIYHIFKECGKIPTVHIGGQIGDNKQNIIVGGREFFITEACEYGDSFLHLRPEVSIINNIEKEHLDYFGSLKNVYTSYNKFMLYSKKCFVGSGCKNKIITLKQNYFGKGSDSYATNIKYSAEGCEFDAFINKEFYGKVALKVLGKHNIHNCLGAIKVADYYGLNREKVIGALRTFVGVKRRFEYMGKWKNCAVIFDYAHHPTEIKSSLKTAQKACKNDVYIFFQPHTYSRTKTLIREFGRCFCAAKAVFICDTYKAREKYDKAGDAKALAEAIKASGNKNVLQGNVDDIVKYLDNFEVEGTLLFVGAGDMQDNLLKKITFTN